MKKYIEPKIKIGQVESELMLRVSNGEGYGDPMSKENSFFEEEKEEDGIPTLHSVWEE